MIFYAVIVLALFVYWTLMEALVRVFEKIEKSNPAIPFDKEDEVTWP